MAACASSRFENLKKSTIKQSFEAIRNDETLPNESDTPRQTGDFIFQDVSLDNLTVFPEYPI